MAYQTIWTPDPLPPQQQPGQYQPIYIPTPPPAPTSKPLKPGKSLSVKRMKKIAEDWHKIIEEIEETKKKGKGPDKKKREGLNWIELTLLIMCISLPVAAIELGGAFLLVHLIGK